MSARRRTLNLKMKKNYSKSKLLLLIFILLAFVSFYSCNKLGKLDGTTWKSDPFETKIENSEWRIGTMTISFGNQKATIQISEIFDGQLNISYTDILLHDKPYQLKGKDLTIEMGTPGIWSGTVNNKTMSLEGVYGKTVKFKKIKG